MEKIFTDVSPEHTFRLSDNRELRNIGELLGLLKNDGGRFFAEHVTPGKNDFACWIGDVVGDAELSQALSETKELKTTIEILEERIAYLESLAQKTELDSISSAALTAASVFRRLEYSAPVIGESLAFESSLSLPGDFQQENVADNFFRMSFSGAVLPEQSASREKELDLDFLLSEMGQVNSRVKGISVALPDRAPEKGFFHNVMARLLNKKI